MSCGRRRAAGRTAGKPAGCSPSPWCWKGPRAVENVWEYLRQNKLALRLLDDYEAIVDACCKAWNDLLATPARLASITARDWAKAS